jgi:CheY-like chemotaxis protein
MAGRPVRVLVADDESACRQALAELLESAGYDVDTAVDGMEALRKLLAQPPDILVTDFRMPKLDGIALLRHTRTRAPTCKRVLMSAETTPELHETADAFLPKPVNPVAILDVVARLVGCAADLDIVLAAAVPSPVGPGVLRRAGS